MSVLRIKEILREKGMTAKTLASKLLVVDRKEQKKTGKTIYKPMDPQQINAIINGGKEASLNKLQEIARVLDVPMATLFADYKPEIVDNPIVCPKCGTRLIVKVEQDPNESENKSE